MCAACYDRLADLHAEMEQALAGLPPEALDWTPGPGFNSLAVLAVHAAGAERYWLGDVAGGLPSGRDREAEFRVAGLELAQVTGLLVEVLATSRQVLESLRDSQVGEMRVVPRDGRSTTLAWCLAHAVEHTAEHTGQMQLTRQLWEARASAGG
jgi:uncharacterized damage-inducible protein DinB